MTSKLLIPMLHFSDGVPEDTIWVIHQSITLMRINASDLGPLTASIPRDLYELTDRDTGCFYISPPDGWSGMNEAVRQKYLLQLATIIRFSLHRYMEITAGPVQLTFAVEIANDKFVKMYSLTTVDSLYSPSASAFILPDETKRAAINKYYETLLISSSKLNTLIPFERYNSSLFRTSLEDKLIDCTISAESLIGATTELSYKFALFLSYVAGIDAVAREYCFKLLKLMYDTRSKLVHGDSATKEKLDKVESDWDSLQKIILGCLDYYSAYNGLADIKKGDWLIHLNSLVMGSSVRNFPVCSDLVVPVSPELTSIVAASPILTDIAFSEEKSESTKPRVTRKSTIPASKATPRKKKEK